MNKEQIENQYLGAIENDDLDTAFRLLQQYTDDIDINLQDENGRTVLMLAIANEHFEIVQALLKQPNIDVNLKDAYDRTALKRASEYGYFEIVKLLLKHPDIDVNVQDKGGETALIAASVYGHFEVVELLLKHPKINVNLQNIIGRTALIYAQAYGYDNIVKIIEQYQKSQTTYSNENKQTLDGMQRDLTNNYLKKEAGLEEIKRINEKRMFWEKSITYENYGEDALIVAVQKNDIQAVKQLINDSRIDVNYEGSNPDNHNRTALFNACYKNLDNIVEVLLQNSDVDENKSDEFGLTPLMIASLHDYTVVVNQLLTKRPNIDINAVDNHNWTALTWSSASGAKNSVEILLNCPKIDKNKVTIDNKTALDYAKYYGHKSIVQLFNY